MGNKLLLTFANGSDVGLVRSNNQDNYGKFPADSLDLSIPSGQLFIIADGMGGHKAGETASQMAIDIIRHEYFANRAGDIARNLQQAFETANEKIYNSAQQNPDFQGMGTTCIAIVLKERTGYIAHVGDSRAYRITRNSIEQLTKDHSQVAEMMRKGILTEAEAQGHPERSLLTRALGAKPEVETDIIKNVALEPGEWYLLCTDGLAKVSDKEIKRIVSSNTPLKACRKLIDLANRRGGEDNVTVQVISITEEKPQGDLLRRFKQYWLE